MREKRSCLERSSLSKTDLPTKITEAPDSVMPSIYIGQSARLVEEGDIVTSLPLVSHSISFCCLLFWGIYS